MRDVVIVGGGPVGVFLAALLAERGLDVAVWEKRTGPSRSSRAIGVHPPSLEAFTRIGVADAVAERAVRIRHGIAKSGDRTLGTVSFDRVSTEFPFVASLPQYTTEAIIADRLEQLAPGSIRRGVELRALDDHQPDRVRLHGRTADGDVFEVARFVVGADGPRSTVRTLVGITAPLTAYPDPFAMADFRDDTGHGDDAVVHLERAGVVESFPLPEGRRRYVVHLGAQLAGESAGGSPTPEALAAVIRERTGSDVDPATATTLSTFVPRRRIADRLVHGRVVLVGDAAHEISPIGGQGMNLGWLDASALAPILVAEVSRDRVDAAMFDDFEARRLRSARRAARQAEANMAMGRPSTGIRRAARDAGFGIVLATPASHLLARTYSMAWRPLGRR